MHRPTFLNIVADILMQIYLWYFIYSDSFHIYRKIPYIVTTLLFYCKFNTNKSVTLKKQPIKYVDLFGTKLFFSGYFTW